MPLFPVPSESPDQSADDVGARRMTAGSLPEGLVERCARLLAERMGEPILMEDVRAVLAVAAPELRDEGDAEAAILRDFIGMTLLETGGHEIRLSPATCEAWDRREWAIEQFRDPATEQLVYRLVRARPSSGTERKNVTYCSVCASPTPEKCDHA